MSSVQLTARIEPTVASAVAGTGFELAGLEITQAGRRRLVKVVVDTSEGAADQDGTDRADGAGSAAGGLDLDAVATVSRAVSGALDQCDDLLGGPYTLEVSSPGLDRPLTRRSHWRRARLRLVEVRLAGGEQLLGRVGAADDTGVTLLVAGQLRRIGYHEVERAVVQVEFREPPAAELRALEPSKEESA